MGKRLSPETLDELCEALRGFLDMVDDVVDDPSIDVAAIETQIDDAFRDAGLPPPPRVLDED